MISELLSGLLLPFLGTAAGALAVFFLRGGFSRRLSRALDGFAAGVMCAAATFSLLLPAIAGSAALGRFSFLPAAVGFLLGILLLILCDKLADRVLPNGENSSDEARRTALTVFAVTLHNIPEGMAVGAVLAGLFAGDGGVTASSALALSAGIAIQNLPEGAIVSLPLAKNGLSRRRAALLGVLSGAVEPVAGGLTVLLSALLLPALPVLLSLAAGAMISVVVEELVPSFLGLTSENGLSGRETPEKVHTGTLFFALGYLAMMALDVAFG